ncbi:MAG: FkbM family methyltransferase [Bacteroidota bacterium]
MKVLLPSSTDIYLTGGKSHTSEIRLAKFMINHLKEGNVFVDVGAHYGYFTLLASELVGNDGKVFAFEASPQTFSILKENCSRIKNIEFANLAVSDSNEPLEFYEFPNKYAEYNTIHVHQFEDSNWYQKNLPNKVHIASKTLDHLLSGCKETPRIIKIDVEGAEYQVLNGAQKLLDAKAPLLVMEYLSSARGNDEHKKAETLLYKLGYTPFAIDEDGAEYEIKDIEKHISSQSLESDNIVFKKAYES